MGPWVGLLGLGRINRKPYYPNDSLLAERRRIGLVSIPVLNVSFRFSGAEANARREFMAYFDLYTKRGGG